MGLDIKKLLASGLALFIYSAAIVIGLFIFTDKTSQGVMLFISTAIFLVFGAVMIVLAFRAYYRDEFAVRNAYAIMIALTVILFFTSAYFSLLTVQC